VAAASGGDAAMVRSSVESAMASLAGPPAVGFALRSVPSLQLPQSLLVDFLANGHGYDNASVAAAVGEGNLLFEQRELRRAIDFYGVAYELGRLHLVYLPLMHDLVLRRAVCLSMLGDLKRAIYEAELAQQILPHVPSAYLICGIIHSKLGSADEANHAFQMAVVHCSLLRDVVECVIALFLQARGQYDRAIQICTQVLERSPRHLFGLLARGDSYHFHPSGYFVKKAAKDYAAILEEDESLRPFIGPQFILDRKHHTRIDELLLRLHPWLAGEAPRAYEMYPNLGKRCAFFSTSFKLLVVAKLRCFVRSAKLLRHVRSRHDELQQQRATAELRLRDLVEAQRQVAAVESHLGVWGPADPDHTIVRKYRRYWMERPMNFPRRDRDDAVSKAKRSPACCRGIDIGRVAHEDCARSGPPLLSYSSPAVSSLATAVNSPAAVAAETTHLAAPVSSLWPHDGNRAAPLTECYVLPPDGSGGEVGCGGSNDHSRHSGGSPMVPSLVKNAELGIEVTGAPLGIGAGPTCGGGVDGVGAANSMKGPLDDSVMSRKPSAPRDVSPDLAGDEEIVCDAPPFIGFPGGAGDPTSQVFETNLVAEDPEPPPRLGHGWDEQQWLHKALELADLFAAGEGAEGGSVDLDLGKPPHSRPTSPMRPPRPPRTPPPPPRLVRIDVGGTELNAVEAIERYGIHDIPDWYDALDTIYSLTDMAAFGSKPEPFIANGSFAGMPGHSYVIAKGVAASAAHETAAKEQLSEDLLKRYQNRLLSSSLGGRASRANRDGARQRASAPVSA